MDRRVAIAIGVGNTEGFAPLRGAPAGAQLFAEWAEGAGYEVHPFIDSAGPVLRNDVFQVAQTLSSGTVTQLMLFSSGHGVATGIDKDYWLLSHAGTDPAEIIDVRASLDNARAYSRIQHIVVFADACRTLAGLGTVQAAQGGSVLFSTRDLVRVDTELDVYYATKSGDVALERAPSGTTQEQVDSALIGSHGFFTDVLVSALRGDVKGILKPNPQTGALVLFAHSLAAYVRERGRSPTVGGRS